MRHVRDGAQVIDCVLLEVRERRKYEDALLQARRVAGQKLQAVQQSGRRVAAQALNQIPAFVEDHASVPCCNAPIRKHDVVCHSAADQRLRLAALVAGHPARVDVSGIDGVEAGVDEGVQYGEAGLLVGGP